MRPYDFVKRVIDIAASVVGLLLAAPVMGVIALFVYIDLGRPVIFAQVRPGLHGKPFRMYKFRTMRDAYDKQGIPLPDVSVK